MHGDPALRSQQSLRAAVALPCRAHPGIFAAQLLIMVATGLAPVAAAWLLRAILDSLTGGGGHATLPLLVVALAAAGGLQQVLPAVAHYLSAQSGRAIERLAKSELFAAIGRLAGLRRLEEPAFLDRLNLAQRVAIDGPSQVMTSVTGVIQSTLTVTGFLAALAAFSPVMALVVVAAMIPGIFAETSIAGRRAAMLRGISHAERRQYFYANLLTSYAAAKELRLFGLGVFFRGRMLDELRIIHQAGEHVDRRQAVAYTALAAIGAAVAGAGLWWAVSAATRGRLSIGDVSMFVAALAAASTALSTIVSNAAIGYQAVLTFRSYTEIVTEGPDLALPADPVPARPLRSGIEFDDVWFRYGPHCPWALRGVSLVIPHGQATALVGRNGAGKSTMVKLACRFYDPDRGRILWDGVDLRDMDLAGLRDRISAVFQDYMSYELSARENIAVGDLTRAGDHESLTAAARHANIHDTLATLPKGYDTLLTQTYFDLADKEDPQTGVLLSGGQWQRVALARSLLRAGRDVVILDEPSSGLDAEAEHEIYASLRAHRGGSTAILISHRLNAVRDADSIVVLDDGIVVEEGDHDALMAHGGRYARMFSLQARGFADRMPDAMHGALEMTSDG